MNFNTAKSISPRTRSRWQALIFILVFLLLALVIWRWFDYQIARLTFPQRERQSGLLISLPPQSVDTLKTFCNE